MQAVSATTRTAVLFTETDRSQWDGCSLCVPIDSSCGHNSTHSLHYVLRTLWPGKVILTFHLWPGWQTSSFKTSVTLPWHVLVENSPKTVALNWSFPPFISSYEHCSSLLRKEVSSTVAFSGKTEDRVSGCRGTEIWRNHTNLIDISP